MRIKPLLLYWLSEHTHKRINCIIREAKCWCSAPQASAICCILICTYLPLLLTHPAACLYSRRWPRGRQDTERGRCSCGQPGCWDGGDTGSYSDGRAATAACNSLLCVPSCGSLRNKTTKMVPDLNAIHLQVFKTQDILETEDTLLQTHYWLWVFSPRNVAM